MEIQIKFKEIHVTIIANEKGLDGWMDVQYVWMDGWMDGWIDIQYRCMDGWIDGCTV